MISNLDIYRAANLLIERHGVDAVIEAAARLIDRMLYRGDRGGRSYTGNVVLQFPRGRSSSLGDCF